MRVTLNKSLLRWGLLLLWCGLIFFGTGDRHFTGESTRAVVVQAAPNIGLETARQLDWLNSAIRKLTHVVLFAVLAVLARRAITSWPGAGWRAGRVAAAAWLFATLYAASDEWHQRFVPGRTASVWDVLLDATAAALVLWAVNYVAGRAKAEPPH